MITSVIINMQRDPKKTKPVSADSLNPYRQQQKKPIVKLNKKESMQYLRRYYHDIGSK